LEISHGHHSVGRIAKRHGTAAHADHGGSIAPDDRHPGPADLVLVIEVSDSSVGTDRATKQRLYATAGVTQYWLVNLPELQVEVYEQPDSTSGKYAQQTIFRPSQTLAWNLSPTQRLEINVTDLFH